MSGYDWDDFVDTYGQEENTAPERPYAGAYQVVNQKLQWQLVGAKKTLKLRVICKVLSVIATEDKKVEGAKLVGSSFGVDLWTNFEYADNASRWFHMLMACRVPKPGPAFGNTNKHDDDAIMRAITGKPYQLKIGVTDEQATAKDGTAKMFYRTAILWAGHLEDEIVQRHTADPNWGKIALSPEQRWLDSKDYSEKRQPQAPVRRPDAPPIHEDDLAF